MLPLDIERPTLVQAAVEALATQGNQEERGAVFTRAEVVEGILDMCGYVEASDLVSRRLLEPAVGDGEFLFAAVARLLRSAARVHGSVAEAAGLLDGCVRAYELHRATCEATRNRLVAMLRDAGLGDDRADGLARAWLHQDDFLLAPLPGKFDVAVGNPPYVRQERIPDSLLDEYRRTFETLYDRADLYVLFYERCLNALSTDGVLGFICANRWVKNKYGGPLRELVANGFNLDVYIDMTHADAFHEQVDAYPAITIIRRAPQTVTRVLAGNGTSTVGVRELFDAMQGSPRTGSDLVSIAVVQGVGCGRDPWLVDAPEILETIRRLEGGFPTLEASGAKVGIGVATGADRFFIGPFASLPVEEERRVPLVMSGDLKGTDLDWSGLGLVNPWLADGSLASLDEFPRFGQHVRANEGLLKARHTAKANPGAWYRTIDRVYPELTRTPKLLIPDIKGEATVVLDEGRHYPHHNLYFVTSETWDLRALQAVLRSSVALAFVAAYCVRMSGGFLRFQAQYLRRIRVPRWETLDARQRQALIDARHSTDLAELDQAVQNAYGFTTADASRIAAFAASARVPVGKS